MVDIEKLIEEITEQVIQELLNTKKMTQDGVASNLEKNNYTPPSYGKRILITAKEILKAYENNKVIELPSKAIITPLAQDLAKEKNVKIIINKQTIMNNKNSKISKIQKIAIGSDHGGYNLKEKIKDYLHSQGFMYKDYGTFSKESVDYPDFAALVAKSICTGECEKGIIIDGAGIGSAITANKFKGILAAVCHDRFTAKTAVEHDNANVLTLGANVVSETQAKEIIRVFLNTPFAGGRHARRIEKIYKIEKENNEG